MKRPGCWLPTEAPIIVMFAILVLGAVAVSVCSNPSPEPHLTVPRVVVTPPVLDLVELPGVPPDDSIDSYELGRESVIAERRLEDLARVSFFIDCLEQATGRKFSPDNELETSDLYTPEATQCRADTTAAAAKPGFLERVEALQEAP